MCNWPPTPILALLLALVAAPVSAQQETSQEKLKEQLNQRIEEQKQSERPASEVFFEVLVAYDELMKGVHDMEPTVEKYKKLEEPIGVIVEGLRELYLNADYGGDRNKRIKAKCRELQQLMAEVVKSLRAGLPMQARYLSDRTSSGLKVLYRQFPPGTLGHVLIPQPGQYKAKNR